MNKPDTKPTIMAGIPTINFSVYHRLRFQAHDTVVLIDLGGGETYAIMRDIEMERARKANAATHIHCPLDFAPRMGLSGDRDTANAQAAAELLATKDIDTIIGDRTLPMLFIHELAKRGIEVTCDPDMGVKERRSKDAWEIEQLQQAQDATEQAIRRACEMIGGAQAGRDGVLHVGGETLTSERVRQFIEMDLLKRNFSTPPSIVAGGPIGADCHDLGSGELRTGEPIIIDVYPRDRSSLYNGDCTRTVVHGEIPDVVARMHSDVVDAKRAATAAARADATGEDVHMAACDVFTSRGRAIGLPPTDDEHMASYAHGTGHGIGLDVHESPLLDRAGPELVVGDALTIEPGLYCRAVGGVRVEDMVIVTETGCDNLNTIPEGLTWA
ncbi:MAG: aminopeptidase P family protein [Phycisphaerales bacterium]|nr:aminopeptidase P family protein [Phycisphaerales bacterium]